MTYINDSRSYLVKASGGKFEHAIVQYTLYFKNNVLEDIRNEFYASVVRGSDCWNFFNKKHVNHV